MTRRKYVTEYKKGQIWTDIHGNKIKIINVYTDTIVYQYGTKNGWYEPILVKKTDMPDLKMEENMKQIKQHVITDNNRTWDFQQNGVNQLNFDLVAETMSYANPVAFIKDANGVCHHVLVHESLMDKARKAKGKLLRSFPLDDMQLTAKIWEQPVHAYSAYECHDMHAVVTWAKQVKAATFKKTHRSGGRVYIELPRV